MLVVDRPDDASPVRGRAAEVGGATGPGDPRVSEPQGRSRSSMALAIAAVLVVVAVAVYLLRPSVPMGERTFWYDLSEKRLYVDKADLVPPQRGVGGTADDAYLAVVMQMPGSEGPGEVAFLTSYTEELRALRLEGQRASQAGTPLPERLGDRLWVTENTLVRRISDEQWYPKSSPEGQRVISVLTEPGPGGGFPRIRSPED
jgi:hypothetical protein